MVAVTFLSSWEEREWQSVKDDKDCDELLRELRNLTGENWLIGVREYPIWRRNWNYLKLVKAGTAKHYTLYADCHGEWQVINLVTPIGGSVFHGSAQSREDVMNFMLGYISGVRSHRNQRAVA